MSQFMVITLLERTTAVDCDFQAITRTVALTTSNTGNKVIVRILDYMNNVKPWASHAPSFQTSLRRIGWYNKRYSIQYCSKEAPFTVKNIP